jgi:hypothetical protein
MEETININNFQPVKELPEKLQESPAPQLQPHHKTTFRKLEMETMLPSVTGLTQTFQEAAWSQTK